jgi:hypothetical protein
MAAWKSVLFDALVGAGAALVLFGLVWIGGPLLVGKYYGSTVGKMWKIIASYGARAAGFGAGCGAFVGVIRLLRRDEI